MQFTSVFLQKSTIVFISLACLCAGSCKKDNIAAVQSQSLPTAGTDEASVFITAEGEDTRLVLRPGPLNGQDAYVDKLGSLPGANHNVTPELPVNNWTNGGIPLNTRSFLRFDSLLLVPASATVVSAKLHLFGLSNSLNSPQGNSFYPGAPIGYKRNNCLVQQVLAPWDETTLTYDNQPALSEDDPAYLSPSTSQWNYDATIDVIALVQKMVANPSANYGFAIKLVIEEKYRSVVFGSSEAQVNARPKLIVVYN